MAKKRSIVSYDKLTIEQKKDILKSFPDGYGSSMTTIQTPAGETLDALIWETEETILADLAFGFQADFFKCGIEGDIRELKIKRLIEIEKGLK